MEGSASRPSVLSGVVSSALSRCRGCAVVALLGTVALLLAACGRGETATIDVPDDPAVVQTKSGAVRGMVAADHRLFAGIPYAAPPVGAAAVAATGAGAPGGPGFAMPPDPARGASRTSAMTSTGPKPAKTA